MPPETAPTVTIAARDFLYIAPEILLTAWGVLVLLVDVGVLRHAPPTSRRRSLGVLALVGVGATLALILYMKVSSASLVDSGWLYDDPDPLLFHGTLAGDALTSWMNLVLVALLGLVVGMAMSWDFTEHWGECYALLIWATVGMMLLVAADELLTLFLTLEAMTLCLYLATAVETNRARSAEAGLKYFVYGSVSSALFLFGLSLLYGLTGTTRIDTAWRVLSEGSAASLGLAGDVAGATATLLILAGLGFKIAAVPFHQWAPDAYEGAPAPVAAWIAAGSKLASFVALMKILNWALGPWAFPGSDLAGPGWLGIVAVLAALSMTFGNLAALAQRNYKRMLAYSAIAHAGYTLVGVVAVSARPFNHAAAGSVLFYLVIYGFTTVGAFALAAWQARDLGADDIDDLNGLGRESPGLAVCIVLLMLSLIGIPPLAGFFAKLYLFLEVLDAGEPGRLNLTWLVALALVNSVVSAFYYVRVLRAMFLREPGRVRMREASPGIRLPIVLSTVVVVAFGLAPAPLLETMRSAALPMLSPGGPTPAVGRESPAVAGPDAIGPREGEGAAPDWDQEQVASLPTPTLSE